MPDMVYGERLFQALLHLKHHVSSLDTAAVVGDQDFMRHQALFRKAEETELQGFWPIVCGNNDRNFHGILSGCNEHEISGHLVLRHRLNNSCFYRIFIPAPEQAGNNVDLEYRGIGMLTEFADVPEACFA